MATAVDFKAITCGTRVEAETIIAGGAFAGKFAFFTEGEGGVAINIAGTVKSFYGQAAAVAALQAQDIDFQNQIAALVSSGNGKGIGLFGVVQSPKYGGITFPYISAKTMPALFSEYIAMYTALADVHIIGVHFSSALVQEEAVIGSYLRLVLTNNGGGTVGVSVYRAEESDTLIGFGTAAGDTAGIYTIQETADSQRVLGYFITDKDGLNAGELASIPLSLKTPWQWAVASEAIRSDFGLSTDLGKMGASWEFETEHECNFPNTSVDGFKFDVKLAQESLVLPASSLVSRGASTAFSGRLRTTIRVDFLGIMFDGTFNRNWFRTTITMWPWGTGSLFAKPPVYVVDAQLSPGVLNSVGQVGYFEIGLQANISVASATSFALIRTSAKAFAAPV